MERNDGNDWDDWDEISDHFEEKIFSVFHNDRKRLIAKRIAAPPATPPTPPTPATPATPACAS